MRKALVRLASKFNQSDVSLAMSRLRYFPNKAEDFQPGSVIKIPEKEIRTVIFDVLTKIGSKFKPIKKNAEDGLYLGTAGISYMYYHLSKIPTFIDYKDKFLSNALEFLKPALEFCKGQNVPKKELPAFILGNGGIYAVAAVIFNALGDTEQYNMYRQLYKEAGEICQRSQFLSCGSDELFVGRAGYICGALWIGNETKKSFNSSDLYELCKQTIISGRLFSHSHHSPSPLMYSYYEVQYLGAGHGLCSILQYIMSVPGYLDANPRDAQDVKASVDYLLSLQDEEGNFPTAMDELGQRQNVLIHWCHGAGGVVYLLARAHLIWHEDKYLEGCTKIGELIWEKGLLRKGPGLCHGVAGNGYVFLLLYRLTGDDKHLYRAVTFFEFMCTEDFKKARTPDNPYSLYEGLAGTACFLGDLLNPSQAAFPFSNVL